MKKKAIMSKMPHFYILLCLILAMSSASCGDKVFLQGGYVTDSARVITARTTAEINALAREIRAKSGVEFVVATVKNTGALSLKEYASRMFREWNIGGKISGDKGVLIMISVKDRDAWIESSIELNAVISSIRKEIIVGTLMAPGLKSRNYSLAAAAVAVQIAKIIRDDLKADIQPVYKNIR